MISGAGKRVGIIGAGISGIVCGSRLQAAGWSVAVLEKSGDIGGRLSTRRRAGGRWNHGAPDVAPKGERFSRFLEDLRAAGSARLAKRSPTAYTGAPDMRELLRPLATGLDLRCHRRIGRLKWDGQVWSLLDEGGEWLGPFDALVCSIPAPQGVELLRSSALEVPEGMDRVAFDSRWVLLTGFIESLGALGDVRTSVISRIERRRMPTDRLCETWVVQADADWSARHLDLDRDEVAALLWREVQPLSGGRAEILSAHRWRFAQTTRPLGVTHVWQPERRLGLIGDWCLGPTAEDAFTSAIALSDEIRAHA